MESKYLIAINQGGGVDGLNLVSMRDTTSVTQIQNFRQGAAANVLNYTDDNTTKTGNTTLGSAVISNIDTTGLTTGMYVYANDVIPRRIKATISSIDAGASTVTLNKTLKTTTTGTTITFKSEFQLYKMNEANSTGKNYGIHFATPIFADLVNVADTVPNRTRYKAAFVSNVGPQIKKLVKTGSQIDVVSPGGAITTAVVSDYPTNLTSHNDQTSTWLTNGPEGAIRGWGGGICDTFLDETIGELNTPLAAVSVGDTSPYVAGLVTSGFLISNNGLVRSVPGFTSRNLYDSNTTVEATLTSLLKAAAENVPVSDQTGTDFINTIKKSAQIAIDYQDILVDVADITSPPSFLPLANYTGSAVMDPTNFARNLQQIARLMHCNSPNRGFTCTRSANVVTMVTEVTTGTATRTEGSNIVTVTTTVPHKLFTSSTNPNKKTDSVLVTGQTVALTANATDLAEGFKITLDPIEPDTKFSFTTTETTAYSSNVNVRLKHNFKLVNKVYVNEVGFDATLNTDGYQIQSVPNNFTVTVNTTSTGAYGGDGNFFAKPKLINLPKMVIYTGTPNIGWDSHNEANHGALWALNEGLTYFMSLLERMEDANAVVASITEFGRTVGVNSLGTDHGWGNYAWVIGRDIKGNKMFGTPIDLSPTGPHISSGILFPTTSTYSYCASFAKWMGASSEEVLELFPGLNNWTVSEHYIDMLY